MRARRRRVLLAGLASTATTAQDGAQDASAGNAPASETCPDVSHRFNLFDSWPGGILAAASERVRSPRPFLWADAQAGLHLALFTRP